VIRPLSGMLRFMVNRQINHIAEVLNLKIEHGKISLIAKLKGETETISLSFNYVFQGDDICISEVETDKEWVRGVADMLKKEDSKIYYQPKGIIKKVLKHLL